MADPRGLSGAVFQPAPVRDFTKDLLVREQLGLKEAERAQKQAIQSQKELETYMGDIKNPNHKTAFLQNILPEYKRLSQEVAGMDRNSPEFQSKAMKLSNLKNDMLLYSSFANRIDDTLAKNAELVKKNASKLGEETIGFYNTWQKSNDEINAMVGEDGRIVVNNNAVTQWQPTLFTEPEEEYQLDSDIVEWYGGKTREGVFDEAKARKRLKLYTNTPTFQKQFKSYLNQVEGLTDSEIENLSQEGNEDIFQDYYKDFQDYATEVIRTNVSENVEQGRQRGSGFDVTETKGRVLDDVDIPEDYEFGITFSPRDLKVSRELVDKDSGGKTYSELGIINLYKGQGGKIFADVSVKTDDGFTTDFIELTNAQRGQIENELKLPSGYSLSDYFNDKTGGVNNRVKAQPKDQKQEEPKGLMSKY